MDAGVDPTDPRAQELARRWFALVSGFTGGDPGIFLSLKQDVPERGHGPRHGRGGDAAGDGVDREGGRGGRDQTPRVVTWSAASPYRTPAGSPLRRRRVGVGVGNRPPGRRRWDHPESGPR